MPQDERVRMEIKMDTSKLTSGDARQYVVRAIAEGVATDDEFDIDAICDELRDLADGWDFDRVEHDAFWSVVAKHARD